MTPPRLEARQLQRPEHLHGLSALAVQILTMLSSTQSTVDEQVAAAVAANPALVAAGPRCCRWCAAPLVDGGCPRCRGQRRSDRELAATTDRRTEVAREARALVPSTIAHLVDAVVDALDDRGLLTTPVPGDPAGWARAIEAVARAGPPGTAAPDPVTCLRRQAEWHATHGGPMLLPMLLERHPTLFEADDVAVAAREAGLDPAAVVHALRFARRRLTPAPLPRSAAAGPAQPPDVIIGVAAHGSDLTATVLTAADLGLAVDRGGLEGDPQAARWWAPHVHDAEALLDLLDRRAGALRRIATALAVVQREFVLHGPSRHTPLTRGALALRLGLHASTVSRAVAGASVGMPSGQVLPMAAFFGGGVATRAALAALLAGPDAPLSDAAAAAALTATGHPIARRTVAKYRATIRL